MIWFDCKKCNKRHGKADSQAGALVFCECGYGNRVPWSSTAPEPEPAPAQPLPARPIPPRAEDDREPRRVDRSADRWDNRRDSRRPLPARDEDDDRDPPRPSLPFRRRDSLRRVRAGLCFNHPDDASTAICDDCKVPFCAHCLAEIEGKTVCGPCKNFRIAGLGRPPRTSQMAIIALVMALVSGPVILILSFVGAGLHTDGMTGAGIGLCLLAFTVPAAGVVLALRALRDIERDPHLGGRVLASSGAVMSLVGGLWSLAVAIILVVKQMSG